MNLLEAFNNRIMSIHAGLEDYVAFYRGLKDLEFIKKYDKKISKLDTTIAEGFGNLNKYCTKLFEKGLMVDSTHKKALFDFYTVGTICILGTKIFDKSLNEIDNDLNMLTENCKKGYREIIEQVLMIDTDTSSKILFELVRNIPVVANILK